MIPYQEIFDKVTDHLLIQRERCMGAPGQGCVYRGSNGLMCAVGCLINDENYTPALEDRPAHNYDVINAVAVSQNIVIKDTKEQAKLGTFLRRLQHIHDEDIINNWEYRLKEMAEDYELEWKQ